MISRVISRSNALGGGTYDIVSERRQRPAELRADAGNDAKDKLEKEDQDDVGHPGA